MEPNDRVKVVRLSPDENGKPVLDRQAKERLGQVGKVIAVKLDPEPDDFNVWVEFDTPDVLGCSSLFFGQDELEVVP
jgi:hypothetical protein